MSILVCGDRSALSWHIQTWAAQQGRQVDVVDPDSYVNSMPSVDEVTVVLSEEETEAAPHYTHLIYLADSRLWTPLDPAAPPTDEELARDIRKTTRSVMAIMDNLPAIPDNIVLASSISAGNHTAVGQALAEAAILVEQATENWATRFMELQFPQIFGEKCPALPGSLVAQLCVAIAGGRHPRVSQDRVMTLMYAQEAARILCMDMPDYALTVAEFHKENTADLATLLNEIAQWAPTGALPNTMQVLAAAEAAAKEEGSAAAGEADAAGEDAAGAQQVSPVAAPLLSPSVPLAMWCNLYSTLRAAEVAVGTGRNHVPQLRSAVVIADAPRVTSRVLTLSPGDTLTVTGMLQGLHRVAIVSGVAEVVFGDNSAAVYVAEAGKDHPAFVDVPHGMEATITAVGEEPCAMGEWVSQP